VREVKRSQVCGQSVFRNTANAISANQPQTPNQLALQIQTNSKAQHHLMDNFQNLVLLNPVHTLTITT